VKKKHNLTWWKKKTWKKFSKYIRLRDALATTGTTDSLVCFTCGKIYPAFGKGCAQAGHYVPGRNHAVLFEENGVHGQCYNCNVNLKSNTILYRQHMIEKYGEEETKRIEQLYYNKTFKYRITDLKELCEKLDKKIKDLEKRGYNGS